MLLKNHIAYRFLVDSDFWMEVIETQYPETTETFEKTGDVPNKIYDSYHSLDSRGNKPYMVSDSVIEHLDVLKITKTDNHFNWNVFTTLPQQKVTFIFSGQRVLRMYIVENTIWFCYLTYTPYDKETGRTHWVMFYIDKETGKLCELTDNNEEIVQPGKTYGTRKTGKTMNDFKFPITVVTSKWNTTTIRTESFGVRGHFRMQPCGKGRMNYELIFIAPFNKNGYKRTAGKLLN